MSIFRRKQEEGFTLVELLVVLPIMVLSLAVLATYLITLYGKLLEQNGQLELGINAQQALFTARDDLFFANRFAGSNQTDTTDPYAPGGDWSAVPDKALIVYEHAYTANRQIAGRSLVYKANTPYACGSANIADNQYATNTVIYFLSGDKIYRRVLIPDQSDNCSTTFRKQTCPAANASASCPADTVIAENVQTYTLTYYDRFGALLTDTKLTNNPDAFIQAQRAEINLTLRKSVNAEFITANAKINIKKLE